MAWWTAKQALEAMQVRPQTLYANVSRGRIRARPDPKNPRRSLYHSEDVQRLAKRQAGRRTVAAVAAQAIGWGDPVLASSVSTVTEGRPWYRGQDAVALSETRTLEQVAELLWNTQAVRFDSRSSRAVAGKARASALSTALLALSGRVDRDLPSQGRTRALLVSEAMGLVGEVIDAMLGPAHKPGQALHKRMARAWGAPRAEDMLRRALVLLADHELNASTFATRVAASTGTPLAAALLAGLATLAGPLHAGATVGAQALIETARRNGAAGAVREHLAQGLPLASFGHPLYPEGDPRAAALFAHFTPTTIYAQVREEVGAQIGELPNIDFALCALSDRYGLPSAAPFIIFALARCVGWIAHALEQIETGQLIRPRARYVGPAPGNGSTAADPVASRPQRGVG